ncbi:MAG: peptidoglycan DD-metalloendopeptidase family protein [Rhodanobacter sp.]
MHLPDRFSRAVLCPCLLAVTLGGWSAPGVAQTQTTQQAQAKKQLRDVHNKMEALGKQQADTAARRDSFNAELARKAEAVSRAARALRETDAAIAAGSEQLSQLQRQRSDLQAHLAGQRQAIAELLRATYALGRSSDLRLLLGDEDVARISRALVYSTYFQRDRIQRVRKLMTDLATLQQVEEDITARQQALQAARAERAQQAGKLGAERAAQQKLVAQANAQYQDQAAQLAALKHDAQALDSLVATLQKAIDAAAREERAKAEASRAAAAREAARSPRSTRKLPPPPAPDIGSARANIRGNLPWPASGAVTTYGNGVLIKADGGADVHAVARGKVIYAGFLRGYGLLVILNHGDGWMSMYGNNEALLHKVGDQVDAGTVLGTASPPTGINTGAYFELRQNNKPVDPRRWLSTRK